MELQKKIIPALKAAFWAERDRLVLWTPVWLAIGIGLYFQLANEPPLWAGLAVLAVLSLAWLGVRRFWAPRALATALLLVALGFSLICLKSWRVDAPALYSTLFFKEMRGTIEDMQDKDEGQRLKLSHVEIEGISPEKTPRYANVTLKAKAKELRVGDNIAVKAILFPPPTPAMPGAYDFSRQYYYDQIGAVGFAPKPPVVLAKAQALGWETRLTDIRLSLARRIESHMSPDSGAVAAALMVGEMSGVSDVVAEAMRDAGIYHVLSISGLHMTLACGLLYAAVRFLLSLWPALALRWPVKKIAALFGLSGGLIYLLLAGYPVPAVRSFVMVACVMLAVLVDRRGISVYSLAWAATLVLLFQPEALLGASFQLSFAATLAIVAFYERYSHLLRGEGRGLWRMLRIYFWGLMATSLVASLATTPLVIYHFNRFTVWGIAANMLMMPLASLVIMPAAVLSFLMMPFGLEAAPLAALDAGIRLMTDGAKWFASLSYASVPIVPLTFGGVLLFCAGGLWLCLMSQRWRYGGIAAMALAMGSVYLHQPYDLMISSDGKQVALRQPGGGMRFIKGRGSSYDAELWLRYHGQEEGSAIPPAPARSNCEEGWCYAEGFGRRIATSYGRKKATGVCAVKADIIITDRYADAGDCKP